MRWVLAVCVVLLLGLVFFGQIYGTQVRVWLSPRVAGIQTEDFNLQAQNQLLQAQLSQYRNIAAALPSASSAYVRAMVYSRYPLNFKNELVVNVGSNGGVAAGKPVVFQGILLGSVEKVFPESALIQTVFDSSFKKPVRIGDKGYDGLFIGGAYPRVASIPQNAALVAGDIVYSAAAGGPYGLPLGTISATSTSADGVFQEATIDFAYDLNSVQSVLIAK